MSDTELPMAYASSNHEGSGSRSRYSTHPDGSVLSPLIGHSHNNSQTYQRHVPPPPTMLSSLFSRLPFYTSSPNSPTHLSDLSPSPLHARRSSIPYMPGGGHRSTLSRSFSKKQRISSRGGEGGLRTWFTLSSLIKIAVLLAVAIVVCLRYVWEVQLELSLYRRQWIQDEITSLSNPPLDLPSTCFSPSSLSLSKSNPSTWNYSSPFSHSLSHLSFQSSLALTTHHDCFAFASLIRPSPLVPLKQTYFHSYWRADLAPFTERQAWTLKSFLATQPLSHSTFTLWSNGDLPALSPVFKKMLEQWPGKIEFRRVDVMELAKGTAMEGRTDLLGGGIGLKDEKAWLDGDLVRLLVLWNVGGVWVDMDMILVRSLQPLLEDEWVTQWDCYNKPYQSLNGAIMHFHPSSPFLCTFLTLISLSPPPSPSTTTWGSHLYLKAWRRLVNQGIVPFQVLPWCFVDPRNCRTDKRVPDPFEKDPSWWGGRKWAEGGRDDLKKTLDWQADRGVFSLHLHNQWNKDFPTSGWVRTLLLEPMDALLESRLASAQRVVEP